MVSVAVRLRWTRPLIIAQRTIVIAAAPTCRRDAVISGEKSAGTSAIPVTIQASYLKAGPTRSLFLKCLACDLVYLRGRKYSNAITATAAAPRTDRMETLTDSTGAATSSGTGKQPPAGSTGLAFAALSK